MTAERWQQVKDLFHAASERAGMERAAFLDVACAEDDELRREVESLLAMDEQAASFLKRPVLAVGALAAKAPAAQTELETGRLVGHYRIERRLGAGGMGVVYLAGDMQLGRSAAIKLLQTNVTQDAARVRRFRQEARAASALNHPNILTIYEVGQDDLTAGGAHYIAAEFVDGQTLRTLGRGEGLELGRALDILIQVAGALSAAHEAGIIHRDIKPENIMLRKDGLVKVLDFGLAKLTEHATRPHGVSFARATTQPGVVMGTVNYMSPEQARGLDVDERTDIFSLGAVMYELLTGRAPFQGETTGDILVSLLAGEPRPLARYVAKLPGALQRIINRALAKSAEQRYQTARELGAELKRLKEELEFVAKLRGQQGGKDDKLTLTVGVAVDTAEHSTFDTQLDLRQMAETELATSPGKARFAALRGLLRRRRKALAPVSLALVISAAALGWRWLAPHDSVIDSVAVLPFANVDDNPQMAYLADGLTESLIDSLMQLPALRVSARSTVFSYKGREIDPRRAGKELQVRAVITGRVAWQGERLIIRAELVDAADGSRVWSDEFQRTRSQIVAVQGDITREIAAKLHRRLSPASQQQLARRHSTDSKAYELYAQGRSLYLQYTQASQNKALDYFRQAIKLDPHYALAYCGIADVYADWSSQYMAPSEAIPKAREAALKAIELDETLPEARHSLALVKLWGDWDWAGAEREYKRALELSPNLVLTRIYYARFLSQQGRFEEALSVIRQAEEYDPLSIQAMTLEGNIFIYMRQYERAIEIYRNILKLGPDNSRIQGLIGIALSLQGMRQQAVAQMSQLQTPGATPSQRTWPAYVRARAGQRNEALKLLRELKAQAARERVSPLIFARLYIGLGDKEQAFVWLRKGYEEHSDQLVSLGHDPIYDPLRSDPRFDELLRGIGLAR